MGQLFQGLGKSKSHLKLWRKDICLKRGELESVSYIATVKATSTTSLLCPSLPSQANKVGINDVSLI